MQELNEFIKEIKEKPEIICAEEAWLKPALDFVTKGFRQDRAEDRRIKQGIRQKEKS